MAYDPTATMEITNDPLFSDPNLQMAYDFLKVAFALSPLLLLFVVVYAGFDTEEEENKKRKKNDDFELAGHGD